MKDSKPCLSLGLLFSFAVISGLATAPPCASQGSQHALRFFGTGGPGQQDRVILVIDDNRSGPAGNTPLDIGQGSFTIEWWMRGELADNATGNAGGDVELGSIEWIDGNIIIDRDVWCGTERKYGLSIAGGFVRFGVGPGDAGASGLTIEGNSSVLDGGWHHVAAVREITTGRLSIYIDGVLDFSSSIGSAAADVSYPDSGIPIDPQCVTGQRLPDGWWLTLAGEKHDLVWPSYAGFMDELRIWDVARSAAEISESRAEILPADSPGLVAYYRFEEGQGTLVADSSAAGSPDGDLRSAAPGNGEWVSYDQDPLNTAPILDLDTEIFSDGFEAGNLTAWSASAP